MHKCARAVRHPPTVLGMWDAHKHRRERHRSDQVNRHIFALEMIRRSTAMRRYWLLRCNSSCPRVCAGPLMPADCEAATLASVPVTCGVLAWPPCEASSWPPVVCCAARHRARHVQEVGGTSACIDVHLLGLVTNRPWSKATFTMMVSESFNLCMASEAASSSLAAM